MEIELNSAEFCLKENNPLSLRSANGLHITCTDGTLWITMAGQAEDIFLSSNQRYLVQGNGLLIVESVGQARFRLETPKLQRSALIGERLRRLLGNRQSRIDKANAATAPIRAN